MNLSFRRKHNPEPTPQAVPVAQPQQNKPILSDQAEQVCRLITGSIALIRLLAIHEEDGSFTCVPCGGHGSSFGDLLHPAGHAQTCQVREQAQNVQNASKGWTK